MLLLLLIFVVINCVLTYVTFHWKLIHVCALIFVVNFTLLVVNSLPIPKSF